MKIDKMKEKQVVSSPVCLGRHGNAPRHASRTPVYFYFDFLRRPSPSAPPTHLQLHPPLLHRRRPEMTNAAHPPTAATLDIQPSRCISLSITLPVGSVEEQDGVGLLPVHASCCSSPAPITSCPARNNTCHTTLHPNLHLYLSVRLFPSNPVWGKLPHKQETGRYWG